MTRGGSVVVALVVALAVLVAIGRFERERRADRELAGMRAVLDAVGPIDRSLEGFRILPPFDCLVYRRGGNPFALEICVDDAGRVREAIDRRAGRRIWSLRDDPAEATLRLDRAEVDGLLRGLGVPDRLLPTRGEQRS